MNETSLATDAQLVLSYQQNNDSAAFGALYNRYYEKIFRYCLSILKDRDAALDLTQEVFLKAAEHLTRLKNPVTFAAWLFRIAHNECMDRCKEGGRTTAFPESLQNNLQEEPVDTEDLMAREHRFSAMEELMQELGEDARMMLQLKYLQHYSIQDLQEKYQLSESAVKMRLARARNRIESLYQRRYAF